MNQLPNFCSIEYGQYPHDLEKLLKQHLNLIEQLLETSTEWSWVTLMQPLQELDNTLERFWSPIVHLHAVVNSEPLRQCYETCLGQLSAHESAINHNTKLFQAISSLESQTLSPAQQKILQDTLRHFKLAGVSLNTADKKRFQIIDARLSELSNQFENNLLDAEGAFELLITDEKILSGLPDHALQTAQLTAHSKQQPGWLLTLAYPIYLAVLTYAHDRGLRETFYRAYSTRASDTGPLAGRFDNTPILSEILALKHEQAALLGFANYAEYSLSTKMVNSPTQVIHFLTNLRERAKPQAMHEYQALTEFAQRSCQLDSLQPWDISYVSQQKKQHDHALDDEQLRAYFPLPRVMQGLFTIINTLFSIELRELPQPLNTWHTDVSCYALYDAHQQLRGYLYCDLFARSNKRSGAWMDSLQSRVQLTDNNLQLPIATLTCNFANTAGAKPATLSHDEVVTLLHEMGHCLHHLLTQVNYLHASGINGVEWDAVELPSQLLENWAWTPEGLALLSAHVDTGGKLPNDLLTQLLASKQFQAAMALMRQLELALFDFEIHLINPQTVSDVYTTICAILTDIQQHTRVTPIDLNARLAQSFSHIFAGGYAAGYYSYLWAEILSADAFARFQTEGILNPEIGQDFMQQFLEVGSTRPAAESYRHFRHRDATLDAFLQQHGIAQ